MQTHDKEFPFSREFQLSILKLMTVDDVFMLKCIGHIKEEYFEDKYLSWVFRTISGYHGDYNKAPSTEVLNNEARKHAIDKQTPFFEILKEVLNVKNMDEEYVRKELTGFIRRNIFVSSYKRAANLYNLQNTEGAYEFTRLKMDELLSVDFEKEDTVDFKKALLYVDDARKISKKSVPTGISFIDSALGGGMTPGSLTTLLSGTNAGKSMALLNIGYWAALAGKRVISIHHEDEEGPTVLRAISRFTRIPYNKLTCPSDVLSATEKEMIKAASIRLNENWCMKFMYGSDTTVEQVREWLMLKKKEFDFDLIIDDYGQFIRTKRKTEGERFTESVVYRTFKQIALELNVAMITCAQGNRMAQKMSNKGTDYLRSTDIAECFEIARVSSNVITLNRSEEDIKNHVLTFYLEKQRSGKVGIAVKCKTDFSRCITHNKNLSPPSDNPNQFLANSVNPLMQAEAEINDNS